MSDLSQQFANSLPIEVRPSKPKYTFLMLACIVATAFLLWLLMHGQGPGAWVIILCALGSSFGVVVSIYGLFAKRPLVLLDVHGVTARGWKGCPVAWSNIEHVWKHVQHVSTMYSTAKADYVCMAFKHSESWRRSQGPIRGRFAAWCHSMGYGDMYFSTKGMNFKADELVAAIQSHIGATHLSALANSAPETVSGDA